MKNLNNSVQDYLAVRRALGYQLEREGRLLPDFALFVEQHGSTFITIQLALEWAKKPQDASSFWWAKRLTMVRRFAQYLQASDPRTEIPSADLIPYKNPRHTPHLYSNAEIHALLQACEHLYGELTPLTYKTLLGLLAVSGIRVGEAINLDRSDVFEDDQLIVIRSGKFGKSREIPLHSTTVVRLLAYAKKRDRIIKRPKSSTFFVTKNGTRYFYQNIWTCFARLRLRAGLDYPDQPLPRIHDFRHSFAVRTLLDWYRNGVDVEAKLPLLSTYMGHVSPSSTYWYLSASPELLEIAAARLETTLGDLS